LRQILITIALLAAVAATVTVPARATSGSAAYATATQASSNVAVIPGFSAPIYPGFKGVPPFPANDPSLAQYHFSQLSVGSVSTSSLQPFDTVILYGLQWNTLPQSAQAAINQFAQTGKVIIWDADATGAQNYASFVHPFSTAASGEVTTKQNGSVVTFPSGSDPLASPSSSSPLFLDPAALVASNHLVQDMSVMNPGAANWSAALIAANATLPSGGWILAWAYGDTANQTGMTIYSGMDADAFDDQVSPNYAVKELGIQLGAQFSRGGSSGGGGGGGGGGGTGGGTGNGNGSGLGAPGSSTFAQCAFAHKPTTSWVRGKVFFFLDLSIATGIHGEVRTTAGKLVASATAGAADGKLAIPVDTKRLPSNKKSALQVLVYVNAAKACTLSTSLSVDNAAAHLLKKTVTAKSSKRWTITLRANEAVHAFVYRKRKVIRVVILRAGKTTTVTLRSKPTSVILRDRAGNISRISLLKK
jgi:hypothetical protein